MRSRIWFAFVSLLSALATTTLILGLNPVVPYYLGFTTVGWAIGLPIVLAIPERVILRTPGSWTSFTSSFGIACLTSVAAVTVYVGLYRGKAE